MIRQYLENISGKIANEDWQRLEAIVVNKQYQPGDNLLTPGETCRHIWFLQHGAARYFENLKGEEITTHFIVGPAFFTSYHSLITQSPADCYIQATEPCDLLALPYPLLQNLYDQSHSIERIGRMVAERQFISEFTLRKMHLQMDASQRYDYLEQHQPEVLQRFQQKDIAGFLGITPVSLSRLRKNRRGNH